MQPCMAYMCQNRSEIAASAKKWLLPDTFTVMTGATAAAALQKLDGSGGSGSKTAPSLLERTRVAAQERTKLKVALQREQEANADLHADGITALHRARAQLKRKAMHAVLVTAGIALSPHKAWQLVSARDSAVHLHAV